MEKRSSSERKSTFIKALIIALLLLLAFLSSVIYVYAYPKTTVTLYDLDPSSANTVLHQYQIKKYSTLGSIPYDTNKKGYTFLYWSYDEYGSKEYDPLREVDTDNLALYANYDRNSYNITFHVQVYNDEGQFETYISDQPGYRTRSVLFGSTLSLRIINLPFSSLSGVPKPVALSTPT